MLKQHEWTSNIYALLIRLTALIVFVLVSKLCPTLLQFLGLEPSRLLCAWDFPDKNTRVGCHFLFQGYSWLRDRTCGSCIGSWILYHWTTWEAHPTVSLVNIFFPWSNLKKSSYFQSNRLHFVTAYFPVFWHNFHYTEAFSMLICIMNWEKH